MNNTEENNRNYNLDLHNLAPISVSVYNRVEHFKNCIKSLEANDLAKYSIFMFSQMLLYLEMKKRFQKLESMHVL